jgi:hypothetical protein
MQIMEKHRHPLKNRRASFALVEGRRLLLAVGVTLLAVIPSPGAPASNVNIVRVPSGGIQPQAVLGKDGSLHLLYFKGEATHGDLFYVRSRDGGVTFRRQSA